MRWRSPGPRAAASLALKHEIKSARTWESRVKVRIWQKLTLSVGLSAHNLITQLVTCLFGHPESLVLVIVAESPDLTRFQGHLSSTRH
jgi:hypothetical protein